MNLLIYHYCTGQSITLSPAAADYLSVYSVSPPVGVVREDFVTMSACEF